MTVGNVGTLVGAEPDGVENLRARYAADGFCRLPRLVPEDEIERVNRRIDAVIAGDYATGRPPYNRRPALNDPSARGLVKIDQPHRADRAIRDVASSPGIGQWAAAMTGARRVQVFAIQLLHKEPTPQEAGVVGWHQDEHYWRTWWEGEAFTIWLALSEVTPESGPVCFVRGSHRWGYVSGADLYNKDLAAVQARLGVPDGAVWDEAFEPLHPGEATMHHRMTFHGSRPNVGSWARRGLAIHLRTERARVLDTYPPYTDEHDLDECPIIWDDGPVT